MTILLQQSKIQQMPAMGLPQETILGMTHSVFMVLAAILGHSALQSGISVLAIQRVLQLL